MAGQKRSAELPPHLQELLAPKVTDRVAVEIAQLAERYVDGLAGDLDHRLGIAVRAAGGFLDDAVDHTEAQHVLRRDLHGVRRLLRLRVIAPQDRGGSLWRDH